MDSKSGKKGKNGEKSGGCCPKESWPPLPKNGEVQNDAEIVQIQNDTKTIQNGIKMVPPPAEFSEGRL